MSSKSHQKFIGFYDNDLIAVPDTSGVCNNLDRINLNSNLVSTILKSLFSNDAESKVLK